MKRRWSKLYLALFIIAGGIIGTIWLGIWLRKILILALLTLVSMKPPDPIEVVPVSKVTSQVYLRNQTDSALFVTLTIPRASLQLDTVWWGINSAPEAVGRAVVAHTIAIGQWGRYIPGPLLLDGSADTLVADKSIDYAATGLMGKRKLYYPRRNLPLWQARLRQYKPLFEKTMQLRLLPKKPDSALVTIAVAPGSTFLLAHEDQWLDDSMLLARRPEDLAEQALSSALLPEVQWLDSLGRSRKRRLSLAEIRRTPLQQRDSTLDGTTTEVRYLEYR